MTAPNRISEIIEEMDRDPDLADALRERILGQQLTSALQGILESSTGTMQRQAELAITVRDAMHALANSANEMASTAARIYEAIARTEASAERTAQELASLREGQERTEQRVASMQGSVDNAVGPAYEAKVANNLRSLLREHLNLRNARILKGPNREIAEQLAEDLETARRNGLITEPELNAAFLLDIIAQVNTENQETQHVAIEISVTINKNDVTRAEQRAGTISTATGTTTTTVVVGQSADEEATRLINQGNAKMIRYPVG